MPRSADAARGGGSGLTVALFTDRRDWHARRLARAFARRGARAVAIRLEDVAFDTQSPSGLRLPGFGLRLPDAALVRSIASGSFEAVTRRLGILHGLGQCGVAVWNDARAIERCVDKSMTTFLLSRAGLPTPATFAVEGADAARAVLAREAGAGALVLKPLFGSQGRGLRLLRSEADLPAPDEVAGVYYLQRFVDAGGEGFRDIRAFVAGGRLVAAMTRRSPTWITNVKRGGRPERLSLQPELADLAVAAAAAVGADFGGVDLLEDSDGRAQVLEVNSMPAWSGLQSVSEVDISGILADRLIGEVGARLGVAASA